MCSKLYIEGTNVDTISCENEGVGMSKLSEQKAKNALSGCRFVEEVMILELTQSEQLVARELINVLSSQSGLCNFQYNMSVEKLCEYFDASIERYIRLFMASNHSQDVKTSLTKIKVAAVKLDQIRTNFRSKKEVAFFDKAYNDDDAVKVGYINIYVSTVTQTEERHLRIKPH